MQTSKRLRNFPKPFCLSMQRFSILIRYICRKVVMILVTQEALNDLSRAIQQYGHSVQSLAFVYLRNRFDAEDIAQDVFVTYLRKAPVFTSAGKERAWLMKVTANLCKTCLRSRHREEIPLTEDISYLPKEESAVLQAVLELEDKYRIPIHLHYYEGYTLEEIAKMLRVRPGTVGSWLSRGREKLRKRLEEDYFEG